MAQLIDRGACRCRRVKTAKGTPKPHRRFFVRVSLGIREGKRTFESFTVHGTETDAQREADRVEQEKRGGTFVAPARMTLDALLDAWIRDQAVGQWGRKTRAIHEQFARLYIRPVLGARAIATLGPADIQGLLTGMAERGLAPKTVKHVYSMLRTCGRYAVKMRHLRVSFVDGVDAPKGRAREMTALSPAEAARFLAAATKDRLGPLFATLLLTGMRPGEALGLRWQDVDLDGACLTVTRALVRVRRDISFGPTKTKKSRKVPLPARLVQVLRDHRDRSARQSPSALVFAGPDGRPPAARTLGWHFKAVLADATLPPQVRVYDLRHTAATLMLSGGVPVPEAARVLGHTPAMLLSTYAHVLPGTPERAIETLAGAIAAADGGRR